MTLFAILLFVAIAIRLLMFALRQWRADDENDLSDDYNVESAIATRRRMMESSDPRPIAQSHRTMTVKAGSRIVQLPSGDAFLQMRQASDIVLNQIDQSHLQLRMAPLYMHFWQPGLSSEYSEDNAWQHQAVFFWRAEEEFPKMSLPPQFETFERKHFIIAKSSEEISLMSGTVHAWFGMPGGGEKFYASRHGSIVPLPELASQGVIRYVEPVEVDLQNLHVLDDRESHFILIDQRIAQFQNDQFVINGRPVPAGFAYMVGGIHIMRNLEPAIWHTN